MDVEWFKLAFEHMLEGLIIMDRARRITYMNPLAHQMTRLGTR
ncbi:PAS domain-containing protein [Bacillus sp. T3]|nr:PAS domain-containing protein [Bacillus sp. T3]